jgi:uncharacterized protein (DUF1697 family)
MLRGVLRPEPRMPRFVALLRGVNVGGAKKVPMADWRALLAEMGATNVRTLLNSGNAVFDMTGAQLATALAKRIATAMRERFGFDVPVIVLGASTLSSIIRACPLEFPEADHPRVLGVFVQERDALAALRSVEPKVAPGEQFHIGPDAAYLHCAGGILKSIAATALLAAAGKQLITTRNWATVLKIEAACDVK